LLKARDKESKRSEVLKNTYHSLQKVKRVKTK
jgi:hypothetical protein